MPDQAVHYPHGWGDFIIGNVVNDRGIRGALYKATHKSTYARVLLKVSPTPNPVDKSMQEYEVRIARTHAQRYAKIRRYHAWIRIHAY